MLEPITVPEANQPVAPPEVVVPVTVAAGDGTETSGASRRKAVFIAADNPPH